MRIDASGILDAALQLPSPNCDDRSAGASVDLVVVHAISLPPECFGGPHVVGLFQNCLSPSGHPYFAGISHLRVSAHFFIDRLGRVMQFVPCERRAWHAGVSAWRGRERCNDFSIGIELEGSDSVPFDPAQYLALNQVLTAVYARYPICDVVGHSDVAPGRKTDPGPYFDWHRVNFPSPK
jgi:N-acetyl-anhydromuramoyl-L-alanine amidase